MKHKNVSVCVCELSMNLDGPWAVRILWVTENGVCELIHIQWNSNSNSNSIQATEWYGQSDECECVRAVHAFASVCTNEKEIDSNTIKMKATTNRTMQQLKQTIFEKHDIRTNEMNGDHTYLCVLYVIFVGWWASELIYKACVKLHTIIREKKTMNTHHLAAVLQKERRKKKNRNNNETGTFGHVSWFTICFSVVVLMPDFACSHERQRDNTNSGLCHLNL